MRTFLIVLFVAIFIGMAIITTMATLQRGIVAAGNDLWPDLWFRATLTDAYFGFLTFYVWVAYKERGLVARIGWFVAIMLLGNFAMSGYVLMQLKRTQPFSWDKLLVHEPTSR